MKHDVQLTINTLACFMISMSISSIVLKILNTFVYVTLCDSNFENPPSPFYTKK